MKEGGAGQARPRLEVAVEREWLLVGLVPEKGAVGLPVVRGVCRTEEGVSLVKGVTDSFCLVGEREIRLVADVLGRFLGELEKEDD